MPEQVDVKPGEEWLVVTCHNHSCGRRILIDPVGPDMRDDDGALILPADTVAGDLSPLRTRITPKFDVSRGSKRIDTHSKGA